MKDEAAIVTEAWNTVLFQKFCRFKHLLTEGLAGHSEEAFARHDHPRGARVLDVGCGFGQTSVQLAERVGPEGRVLGVDCAENFIEAAGKDESAKVHDHLAFAVADVQRDDLGGPFDHAFSRFGTMFFAFPGAALKNVRKALAPGGELLMIVWRRREDNPWLHEAEKKVKEIVPVVSHDQTDQVHCGPGPFSMSGPDMVSDMLTGVGYDRVTFERFDTDICIGRDLDEAVQFAMALGPAGEIIRLAGDEGEKRKEEVDAALREALAAFDKGGEVWAPSSTWFVRARNPG